MVSEPDLCWNINYKLEIKKCIHESSNSVFELRYEIHGDYC